MSDKSLLKALWVKPAVHKKIKALAYAKGRTINDYLFELTENLQVKIIKK